MEELKKFLLSKGLDFAHHGQTAAICNEWAIITINKFIEKVNNDPIVDKCTVKELRDLLTVISDEMGAEIKSQNSKLV